MKVILIFVLAIVCFVNTLHASTVDDMLIIRDIGVYKLEKPFITSDGLVIGGGEPKSSRDGNDAEGYYFSYTVGYDGGDDYAGPNVEVRIYDSTQWMLHELERDLKEYQDGVATKTNTSVITKLIDNNQVIKMRSGGGIYRWVSNNRAILVSYHDLQLQYPVPMEVISAYLKKYPSTLPLTYQIRHPDREKEFIREEFDRLLWIADRWVSLVQEGDPKRKEKLVDAAEHLEEFAKYRKAYFSGLFSTNMTPDIELLQDARMRTDLETIVRTKLAEYKEWWVAHKSDSISLP